MDTIQPRVLGALSISEKKRGCHGGIIEESAFKVDLEGYQGEQTWQKLRWYLSLKAHLQTWLMFLLISLIYTRYFTQLAAIYAML